MKTLLKVIFILLLIVAALIAIVLGGIEWYLRSDSFKQMVREGAREVRGVTVEDFDISLFRGLRLTGITVTNQPDAPGLSFAADSFAVRHRILPLFHKRAELAEIALEHPVATLPLAATTVAVGNTNRFDVPPELQRSGWQFVLNKFTVRNGDLTFLNVSNKPALRLDNLNLDVLPPQSSGTLSATLANGPLTGSFTKQQSRWQFQANAREVDVPVLFRQATLPSVLKGKLQATISLEGGESLTGQGRLEITGGSTAGMPMMGLLAMLLQTPALRDLQLDECRMEFNIATNQLHTPVIRMISKEIELTGHGTASLADGSLNHEMTLSLSTEVANRAPNMIRQLFKEQANGRRALNFHISGTYASPKMDIEERAVQQAADKALNKVQRFLQ